MSTPTISKLRSAAIGSALGLILLEAGAAWMEHSTYFTSDAVSARAAGLPWDYTSVWEVVSKRRAEGKDPLPVAGPAVFLPDNGIPVGERRLMPLSLASDRDYVARSDNGGVIETHTDRYGFRNPDTVWARPLDALLVGNSFVFGSGLHDHETFAAHLRQGNVNAASLGLGGAGPLTALAQVREYSGLLRPGGTMIWFYDEARDPVTLCNEAYSPLFTAYLGADHKVGVMTYQREINQRYAEKVEPFKEEWRKNSLIGHLTRTGDLVDLLTLGHLRRHLRDRLRITFVYKTEPAATSSYIIGDLSSCLANGWQQLSTFREIALLMKAEAQARSALSFFVILPAWERLTNQALHKQKALHQKDAVLDVIRTAGIGAIDPTPLLAAKPIRHVFPAGGIQAHYTPYGYCLIAQAIISAMERKAGACTPLLATGPGNG